MKREILHNRPGALRGRFVPARALPYGHRATLKPKALRLLVSRQPD
jgi:hypothetical protein